MERPREPLTITVYDATTTKAEATTLRLRELGHRVALSTSSRPLFYRTIRDRSPDVVAIRETRTRHEAMNLVLSVAEIELLPILVIVDTPDYVSEELMTHPAVAVVHSIASEAELSMRIGEARVKCRSHREHLQRIERLRARLNHEPQIAQAKIRLMDQCGLSEVEAYAMLRTTSQHQRMRLEEVAGRVLADGVQVVSEMTNDTSPDSRMPRSAGR